LAPSSGKIDAACFHTFAFRVGLLANSATSRDEYYLKTLAELARRLHRQALLARNSGFNPLAERQAAALEDQSQAILWALEKCDTSKP